jgi:acyl-CoA hydrolase
VTVAARAPSESAVETTHLILPPDTNQHGTAFGGRIMQWMDVAAGIAAARHCRGEVVTAAVDELVFRSPIRLGDVVVVKACVNDASRTSLEVGVKVEREEVASGRREHCLAGYFTMVHVDGDGHPLPVPPIAPSTPDELRRNANAKARRAARLAHRPRKP